MVIAKIWYAGTSYKSSGTLHTNVLKSAIFAPIFAPILGWTTDRSASFENPSFVQSFSLFKLVSRAKQSLPVISLEIPVRPSVRRGQKSNPRKFGAIATKEGANPQTYQCMPAEDEWTESTWTHGLDGRLQHSSSYVQYWRKSKRKQICRERVESRSRLMNSTGKSWYKLQALVNI